MPEYLIDSYTVATFWVTASTENEAVNHVKGLTNGLDLYQQVGPQDLDHPHRRDLQRR